MGIRMEISKVWQFSGASGEASYTFFLIDGHKIS